MSTPLFSIWSSFDVDLTPEEMVLALEERGMSVCELSDEHGEVLLNRGEDPEKIGREFKEFAAAHGVSFPQGHLWLKVHLCDPDPSVMEILKKWLILFASIGVKNAVLHMDRASFPEGTDKETLLSVNAEKLKVLSKTAEEWGIRICLENLRGAFECVEDLLDVIDLVGSPAIGICLDTGHLNISHASSQEHFIKTAGDKLHALHIADNEGETDQHMMPFGKGNVDFQEVMRSLKAIGYSDLFNYEIPGERRLPMELRAAKTEYLKKVTEYLYR